jgi:hypothetical protein
MLLEFKTATVADIDSIIALQEQIWEPTYRAILDQEQINYMFQAIYSKEALQDQMVNQDHKFIIARSAQQLSGFAAYSKNTAEPERLSYTKFTSCQPNRVAEPDDFCWKKSFVAVWLRVETACI